MVDLLRGNNVVRQNITKGIFISGVASIIRKMFGLGKKIDYESN